MAPGYSHPVAESAHVDALVGEQARCWPFVAAALGVLPAMLLAACSLRAEGAPRWTDVGVDAVLLGAGLTVWCASRRTPAAAFVVLAGTPLLALTWRLAATCASLWTLHEALEHYRNLARLDVDPSVAATGPWLIGALDALLAVLALRRSRGVADARDRNAMYAAAWVTVVGLGAAALCCSRGRPHDGAASGLPICEPSVGLDHDASLTAICVAAETAAVGLALMIRAALRRLARRSFLARVAAGQSPGWRIRTGDDDAPALLAPPGDVAHVLVAVSPRDRNDPYRGDGTERAIGRVPSTFARRRTRG